MHALVTRRRIFLAVVVTVLASSFAPIGCAQAIGIAQVDIYDRNAGEALPIYRHHGRRYVEGHPGSEYAVRIRNCSGGRVLAVLSVDGVNAITGETASPGQSGYVIEPWGYVTVTGWRKSDDGVAAFYFSDIGDSYAARTGRPHDLGVIGVALFRERVREPARRAWTSRENDASPPVSAPESAKSQAGAASGESRERMADSAAPAPSLGTGHGRGEYSPVARVEFERASSSPDDMIALRYETRETLVALGVLPRSWDDRRREPDPFPATVGYVPDP